MSDLKKGDRVTVRVDQRSSFNGVITGEGRSGEWWLVLKDGTKHPNGYHKDFCRQRLALLWEERAMTDIVEELRKIERAGDIPPNGHPSLAGRAADEIELLREALRLCKQDLLAAFREIERELAFSERGRPPVPALPSTECKPTGNTEDGAT